MQSVANQGLANRLFSVLHSYLSCCSISDRGGLRRKPNYHNPTLIPLLNAFFSPPLSHSFPNEWVPGFTFPTFNNKEFVAVYHYKQLIIKEQMGSIGFTWRQSKYMFPSTKPTLPLVSYKLHENKVILIKNLIFKY